jgi:erythromycin esterase
VLRFGRLAAGLLVAFAFSPFAVESQAGGGEAVRAAYRSLQTAERKNDAPAITALLEPAFSAREVDGSVDDRAAFVKNQTESDPGMTVSNVEIVLTRLDVKGSAAEADATYKVTGTYAVNGAPNPLRALVRSTDKWTLDSGAWRLRSTVVHDVITYVDNKLVQNEHAAEHEPVMPSSVVIAQLRTQAVIIPTLSPEADPEQLSRIGTAIGASRIVGMGEGSHGTSEFFAFKDRLYRYLVEKKGFTVFAMEANWGAGLNVDRYIKTGRGTVQQAVASLGFWTWNTPEVVDLVLWMRSYNAAPGEHPILSFAGFDLQDPSDAIGYLAAYLRDKNPAELPDARTALACVIDSVAGYPAKPIAGCRQGVAAFGDQLSSLPPLPESAIAREAITNILQYLDLSTATASGMFAGAETRDRFMAQNVEWLATQAYPHAKIALWAHNGHIGATAELSYHSMGIYLRRRFGADYYTIGQTFGSGTVRALVHGQGLKAVTIPPTQNDTTAALFGPLYAVAFLDLRGLPLGTPLQNFFSSSHGIEEIGGAVDPQHPPYPMQIVVPSSFDGLVYIPTSTASTYGVGPSSMHRDVTLSGNDWRISGIGYTDVTVSPISNGAKLTNDDGLNGTPQRLALRVDATPYVGQSVHVSGEFRRDDLFGYALPVVQAATAGGSVVEAVSGNVLGPAGGSEWTPFTLTLKVPKEAALIDAGIETEGLGSVEVRNIIVR